MMVILLLVPLLLQPAARDVTELVGTWSGTSTCTDRVAAPACNNETVVYEMTTGADRGVVHQRAFKIVNGERDLMGEMDFTYSAADGCWRAEFKSPRATSVWCLSVNGGTMSGTAWLEPGKQIVRAVKASKQ